MRRITALVAFLIFLMALTAQAAAPKEVEFNWASPSILWEGETGYFPCLEPFYIKISNCPSGTSSVVVNIYESSGPDWSSIVRSGLMASYTAVARTSGEYSAFVSSELAFHRYYYAEVVLTTTSEAPVVETGSGAPTVRSERLAPTHPDANTTVQVTRKTVTRPPAGPGTTPAPATGSVTETTVTTVVKEVPEPLFAVPSNSEISKLEFLGSIGAAGFGKSGFESTDFNLAFVTGLKIKVRPVSTNPNIGRFGLYPHASRYSLVLGTVVNDLSYKSTNIRPAIFGLRPVIGLDYEIGNGAIGVSAGAILGNQDTKSKLTDTQELVSGFFVGLSFSADVFQALRRNMPASQNFPATSNTNQ